MAEVIGIIGSIAGLVDVAAKVSIGLLKIARDIGEAGREIRSIARHTSVVSNVLNNLHTVMGHRSRSSPTLLRGEMLVEDALEHCLEILTDCERLIEIFQPLIEKSGQKRTRVKLRIRMLFEKSKFVAHGDALEKLTGIMTLLVTSMNYTHATRSGSISEQTSASLRVQVESSITNVADSCQERVNVTQLLTYQRSYEERLSLTQGPSSTLKTEISNLSLIDFDETWSGSQFGGSTSAADMVIPQVTGSTGTPSGIEADNVTRDDIPIGKGSSKSDTMEAMVEHEDIDMLNDEDFERELDAEFGLVGLEDLLEPYMTLKALQRKTVQFAQGILDTKITDEELASETDEFGSAREEADEAVGDDEVDFDVEREILRLRDVRGQIYSLPLAYAYTWEGVNILLLEIYEHNPEYINPVKLGEKQKKFRHRFQRPSYEDAASPGPENVPSLKPFQLYGADGNPILPRVWSQVIEPGELITMRFYDEKLNGPGAHPVTLAQKASVWLRSWWWNLGPDGLARKREKTDPKERVRFPRGRDDNSDVLSVGSGSGSSSSRSLVDD